MQNIWTDLADLGLGAFGDDVQVSKDVRIYGDPRNVVLGDHVRIDDFTVLVATGPLEICNYAHIASHCSIHSGAGFRMEDFTSLSAGCHVYTASADFGGEWMTGAKCPEFTLELEEGPVVLRKHAVVGTGSVILPGVELGEGAAVGAGAVVNKDLEPWGVYGGAPARLLKPRKRGLLDLEARVREAEKAG